MLSLRCPAQNYAWGRPADQSEVAKIAGLNGTPIDESKPYAELWMGTHPSGPAVIDGGDGGGDAAAATTLKAWLEQHPEALGDRVRARFCGGGGEGPPAGSAAAAAVDLPYLFKVLSVQTALSIQSHPDKALAERLHAQNPKDYKDDNHKPEMALALDGFEALCGFVAPEELARELQAQPELRLCVGDDAAAAFATAAAAADNGSGGGGEAVRAALKAAFTALMTCDAAKVAGAVDALAARLTQERGAGRALTTKEALVLRLNRQYPRDVGVLSAFFLNHVTLEPGQAIYLAANEPHAYVSGELVECMAASDNVIRAGLTPKFRDTEVLCGSLTYATGPPPVLTGERVHDHVRAYRPPFDEFEVLRVDVPAGERVAVPTNPGPLLLLVHEGAGSAAASNGPVRGGGGGALKPQLELRRGSIAFVPAGTDLAFEASATGPLALWAAAVNAAVFAPAAPVAAEPAAVPEPALVAA